MASKEKVTFEIINKHMKAVALVDISKYRDCICSFNALWHTKDSVLSLNMVQTSAKIPFKKSFSLDGAGFSPKTIKHGMSP